MAHFCSLFEGIGPVVAAGSAGRRKGSAPVGEAWLFEGTSSKSIPTNFKYAYTQRDLVSDRS